MALVDSLISLISNGWDILVNIFYLVLIILQLLVFFFVQYLLIRGYIFIFKYTYKGIMWIYQLYKKIHDKHLLHNEEI
jgi:hypothetical protein